MRQQLGTMSPGTGRPALIRLAFAGFLVFASLPGCGGGVDKDTVQLPPSTGAPDLEVNPKSKATRGGRAQPANVRRDRD